MRKDHRFSRYDVNIREYMALGGIYCIELFYEPPQPTEMVLSDINITSCKSMRFVNNETSANKHLILLHKFDYFLVISLN